MRTSRTLREHLQEAKDYMQHTHGYRTILPTKEPPAPVRIDERNRRLVEAVSVIRVVEKHDRTKHAEPWLMASKDVSGEEWRKIPTYRACKLCFGRVPEPHVRRGRVWCAACGAFVESGKLSGLVSADLRSMRKALRAGGIAVRPGG